jgi:hypothetical protein
MSRAAAAAPPLLVFTDQELGLWGLATGGEQGRLWLSTGGPSDEEAPAVASTHFTLEDAVWRVSGPGHDLAITPAGPAAEGAQGGGGLELCHVAGTLAIDEAPHHVEFEGVRCAALPSGKLDSIRLLSAWFPGGAAVALLAARPKNASGQDKDRINVVALGEPEDMRVFDPRLSTTYDRRGQPRSSGIEMWLGTNEESDQYPRRVAALLTDTAPIESTADDAGTPMHLQAYALHCLSKGNVGPGVYVLLKAS